MDDAAVRELVERQAAAWTARDPAAVVADFAPDALFEAPGGVSVRGREAIAGLVTDWAAATDALDVEVTSVVAAGERLALEWTWRERRRGEQRWRSARDAIVADLDGAAITRWREYFDPAEMA